MKSHSFSACDSGQKDYMESKVGCEEQTYLKHLDGKDVVSTCGEFIERLKKLKKV